MSKILIAALVFVLGFAVASVIALGIQIHWQWFLVLPASYFILLAYKHFSEIGEQDQSLIGMKGGRSFRHHGFGEYDDEEE